jgi:hypothetical protein
VAKIIVGFSKARSKFAFLSYLIRLVEGTNFSHVFITWKSNWLDLQVVYQASGTQVNFIDSERFNKKALITDSFELSISDDVFKSIIQECMKRAGVGYSLPQLFWLLCYKTCTVLHLPVKWIPKDGRKLYVCSELVAELLEKELKISFNKELDFVTPKDIYNILKIQQDIK